MSLLVAPHRTAFAHTLRRWRTECGLTQLELALETGISTRHLSFLETGRAHPSAQMVLRLAAALGVSGAATDEALLDAGYAPAGRVSLEEDVPGQVRGELRAVLQSLDPAPALAIDSHWGLIAANNAADIFRTGVAAHLLAPPVNVLRVALHDQGLAPRIANLAQWRDHMMRRLWLQAHTTCDPAIAALARELAPSPMHRETHLELSVPLVLRCGATCARLLQTITNLDSVGPGLGCRVAIAMFHPMNPLAAAILTARSTARARLP
jgi:transcriptional regulator with XRE-family HTH domain